MPASNRACEMFATVHGRNGCTNCGRPYGEHYCNAPVNGGRHVCRFNKGHAGPCHPHINANSSSILAAADAILLPMTADSFQMAVRGQARNCMCDRCRTDRALARAEAEKIGDLYLALDEAYRCVQLARLGASPATVRRTDEQLRKTQDGLLEIAEWIKRESQHVHSDSVKDCGGVASDG